MGFDGNKHALQENTPLILLLSPLPQHQPDQELVYTFLVLRRLLTAIFKFPELHRLLQMHSR